MSRDEDTREIDQELKKKLGVSPALAAAAIFEGIPRVTGHITGGAPSFLSQALSSGQPIAAEGGTLLQDIAEFSRKEVKAIQRFARESGVAVPIVAGLDPIARSTRNAYFIADEDLLDRVRKRVLKSIGQEVPEIGSHIGLSTTSLPMAFHEIGHASPVRGSHAARKVLQRAAAMSSGLPGSMSRYALLGRTIMPPDEDTSTLGQFAYDYAPALAGATHIPEIAEEARATAKAIKGARSQGLGAAKVIREMGPAFATYVGPAFGTVLATLVAKNLMKTLREKGEEKQAAAMPGNEVKAPGLLRSIAAAAWHIGGRTPPKPKSIKPNSRLSATARGRSQAKPPSNRMYHKDLLESLYNPQRGFRIATVG